MSIRDVAKLANVSIATVSRYLNNPQKVSAKTSATISTVINRLGYTPSPIARAFSTGSTNTIAVLASNLKLLGPASTISGIESEAAAAEDFLTISALETPKPAKIKSTVELTVQQNPRGIILIDFDSYGREASLYLPSNIPSVSVVADIIENNLNQISLCAQHGGYLLTSYLLSLGHKNVYHVSVPSNEGGESRQAGWFKALTERGIIPPAPIEASWDPMSGFTIGAQLASVPDITAIFAGNDEIAMGVINGLRSRGKRVPEDVSVTGFDDNPLARIFNPPLTTYRMNFVQAGKASFHMLETIIGQADTETPRGKSRFLELPGEMIVRESTSPSHS